MIYLIDASVYVFRAYFSMPDDMVDPDGYPVNALYGYCAFLCELVERVRPEYIAVAFDESLTTSFRNDIFPAYKANREPTPPDLKYQFERCRQATQLLGVPHFAEPRYEADDIIGAISGRMRAKGMNCVIVTRDKDLAQLIGVGDEYWDYAADRRIGYEDIEAAFGVQPERIADFLALAGDSVDNIPGVPGIGKKTASLLLSYFESLDDIYQNLDAVGRLSIRGAASIAKKLETHRDNAFLFRQLTQIPRDLPLSLDKQYLKRRPPELDELFALYDTFGFGTRLRKLAQRLC